MKVMITLVCLILTSCYRMPSEGEVSVIPNTNNPSLIHKEGTPWAPSMDM